MPETRINIWCQTFFSFYFTTLYIIMTCTKQSLKNYGEINNVCD